MVNPKHSARAAAPRKVFLSVSSARKPLSDGFRRALESFGLAVLTGQMGMDRIFDDILQRIEESDVVVAVMTNDLEGDPNWIDVESVMGRSRGKPTVVFREPGVSLRTPFEGVSQPTFDPQAVERGDLSRIIEELRERFGFLGAPFAPLPPGLEERVEYARLTALYLGGEVMGYFNDILKKNSVRSFEPASFTTTADARIKELFHSRLATSPFSSDLRVVEGDADYRTNGDTLEAVDRRVERELAEHEFGWIVDPLDGTINFAAGLPSFAVAIGVVRRGVPVAGIVYNPNSGHLYLGVTGHGADLVDFRNGQRRRLSVQPRAAELDEAVVISHFSSRPGPRKKMTDAVGKIAVRGVRAFGCGQLGLIAVAEGKADLFWNPSTFIWDVTAGWVIVREAGAYVSSSLGSQQPWRGLEGEVVAASTEQLARKLALASGS